MGCRILEERKDHFIVMYDNRKIDLVRKTPLTELRLNDFNGEKIVGKFGDFYVEELEDAFLMKAYGRTATTIDKLSVAEGILEFLQAGKTDKLMRVMRFPVFLEDVGFTLKPMPGGSITDVNSVIRLERGGTLYMRLNDIRAEVAEVANYDDGSRVAKIIFRTDNDLIKTVFRNSDIAVALGGRDEINQPWLHYVPPDYENKSIRDCEAWLLDTDPDKLDEIIRQGDVIFEWKAEIEP